MKTKLTPILIILFLIFGLTGTSAQVTIGSGITPEKGALLDLKVTEDRSGGVTSETGGLLLPRVNLEKKEQLYPFVREADYDPSNYNDPSYNPDVADPDYAQDKLAHTGLIVYNLIENDGEELCFGLNQWDGKQWNCFQQKLGNAIATIKDCSTLNFMGQYLDKEPLNNSNFMTVVLDVTKAGAYTITARVGYSADPTQDNGYYFTYTGVFMTTGEYTLTVPGAGTPLLFTPTGQLGDVVTITFNGKPLVDGTGNSCPKNIIVEDSSIKPLYTIACGLTTVGGVYQLNQELNKDIDENALPSQWTHYISVTLNVDAEAAGASYIIETNTVDGMYFRGEGILTSGVMNDVRLRGYGKPTSYDNKELTITSNSIKETATTCKATVAVALAQKSTYGWGYYDNTAGYIMQPGAGTRRVVDADINFGTNVNSAVKIVKYNSTQTFKHSTLSGLNAYNPTYVKAMFDTNPEIVLTGFDLDISGTDRATIIGYMVDYIKRGGVLILVLEKTDFMRDFCQALYPGISVSATFLTATRYQFGFMNDEIINGPFGDIRGKFWGNDVQGAISISGLPEEDIVVYSRDSSGRPMIFKHKYYNLFFLGEGGIFANYNGTPGSNAGAPAYPTYYPLAFDNNYVPMTRIGWTGGEVENARLFGNVMAWAVKQAQFNGINTR